MKRVYIILMFLLISIFSTGCMKQRFVTLDEFAPEVYKNHPKTIVILPPMNASTAADAPIYCSTTLYSPIVTRGFYVLPYDVTTRVLMDNGFISTEEIISQPLDVFKEYFGADAVLFTTIHKWDVNYYVVASNLVVDLECTLKSTTTGKTLWDVRKMMVIDLTARPGGDPISLVASIIATSVATAVSDYVPYAHNLMVSLSKSLPAGPYSPEFGKDREKSSGFIINADTTVPFGSIGKYMNHATSHDVSTSSDMATITFFRPPSPRGDYLHTPLVKKDTSTNDIDFVCILGSGTKFQHHVAPGKHVYTVGGEVGTMIYADVEAGKNYYVQIDPTMGWADIRFSPKVLPAEIVSSEDIQNMLILCSAIKPNDVSLEWFAQNKATLGKQMVEAEKKFEQDEDKSEKIIGSKNGISIAK